MTVVPSGDAEPLAIGAFAGLMTAFLCRRHEPRSDYALAAYLLVSGVATSVAWQRSTSFPASIAWISLLQVSFFISVVGDIVTYRASSLRGHPLSHFSGPFAAKASKFWSVKGTLSGKKHLIYADLHARHGKVVRVGPNELSINSLDAFPIVYSAINKLWRGPSYRSLSPAGTSILAQRDPLDHRKRRILWDKALSSKSLEQYEDRLVALGDELLAFIDSDTKNGSLDLHKALSYFTHDFAGSLAFSSASSFHMLRDQVDHEGHLAFLRKGGKYVVAASQISWVYDLMHRLPSSQGVQQFRTWARRQVQQRLEAPSKILDAFTFFYDKAEEDDVTLTVPDLAAEALIVITAGSETALYTMTMLFYLLLSHPDSFARVQQEVAALRAEGIAPSPSSLTRGKLPFLHACVDETLRLFPSVSIGPSRLTPPEGLTLPDSTFIPPGTVVGVPAWCLQRDPAHFSPHPERFRPERFLDPSKEAACNLDALVAFGGGYTICPGRLLAWRQMIFTAVLILSRYELAFAEGFDCARFEDGLSEAFNTSAVPLFVSVTPVRA